VKRLVLDTHLYGEALRNAQGKRVLRRLEDMGGLIWLSAVVAHELMIGARLRDGRAAEAELLRPLVARGQIVAPSFAAWQRAGVAIGALHSRGRIHERRIPKSFSNDLLLAASCAEEDITLVTRNTRDFALIAEEIPFAFIPPWA
jgi:predicted nucleic acid-binding protein